MSTEGDAMREYARNTASADAAECACGGSGWTLTPYDVWMPCPIAAHTGPHPEDDDASR